MSLTNNRINIAKLRDLAAAGQAPTVREVRAALAEIGGLEAQLADLRAAYNRAPKIAAEEANKKLAEIEARLRTTNVEADRAAEASMTVIAELEARLAEAEGDRDELIFCEDCGEDDTKLKENNCWPPRYCHSCRHKLVVEICELRKRAEKAEARQCEKCEASIEEHSKLTLQIAQRDRQIAELEARLAEAERQISRLFDAANHAKQDCVSAECYVCALEGRLAEAEARADITEREFCREQTEHTREILRHGVTKHRAETALARVTELEAESVRQYNHIARLESMYKLGVSPSEPESEFWHEWRIRAEKAEVARRELEGGTGREEGGG